MTTHITPQLNHNGSSACDLIEPRLTATSLIDKLVNVLQQATPNARDYPGNATACTADREPHYDRIRALRDLQGQLIAEALAVQAQAQEGR